MPLKIVSTKAIPVSCMRTESDNSDVCLCHLDEGAGLTPIFELEDDFLPPFSSSPPEITSSSSPHSTVTFADADDYDEYSMSSSSNVPWLPRRNDLSLEPTLLESRLINVDLLPTASRTSSNSSTSEEMFDDCALNGSCSSPNFTSPDESPLVLTGAHCENNDADNDAVECEGNERPTKTLVVLPQDRDLEPSPEHVMEISPIAFSLNFEFLNSRYETMLRQISIYVTTVVHLVTSSVKLLCTALSSVPDPTNLIPKSLRQNEQKQMLNVPRTVAGAYMQSELPVSDGPRV